MTQRAALGRPTPFRYRVRLALTTGRRHFVGLWVSTHLESDDVILQWRVGVPNGVERLLLGCSQPGTEVLAIVDVSLTACQDAHAQGPLPLSPNCQHGPEAISNSEIRPGDKGPLVGSDVLGRLLRTKSGSSRQDALRIWSNAPNSHPGEVEPPVQSAVRSGRGWLRLT